MADCTQENSSEKRSLLRYHEKLDGFRDTIETYYSEKTVDVYRTVKTNPPTDDDLIPQRYQTDEGFNELLIEYTEDEIAEMTDEEKRDEVSGDAISVNTTLEKCIFSARRAYKTVKKNHPDSAEDFKKSRGSYVARFSIKPQHGLITKSRNGHRNLLLREDVHVSDILDPSFDLYHFDYDADSDNGEE